METLTTFLFLGIAILAGLIFGILGFIFVVLLGVIYQSSQERKREMNRLYEALITKQRDEQKPENL